jgi:opacity protein-like surface antigen
MKKIIAGLLLSAGCVASATAAEPGPYVSVEYGPASYTNASGFPNPGVLRIAGGANITPNFGVELGYSIFGNSGISGPGGWASIDSTSSLQMLAVGNIPLGPQVDLFGKLGLAFNSYTLDCNTAICYGSYPYNNTALAYALGAKFNVSRNLGIQAEYMNYGAFDNDPFVPLKASAFTIGAVFGF